MNMNSLEMGDMIRIQRFGYSHIGIYVGWMRGRNCVVHNDKFGGVVLSTLEEFSDNQPVHIHKKAPDDYFVRTMIKGRAMALLGKKYDLLTFNCEHLANLVQSGKSESPQLQGAVLLFLCIIGVAALASGD
jgi:hypothetical protein